MTGTNTKNTVLAVGAAGHFVGLVVPALASRGVHVRGWYRGRSGCQLCAGVQGRRSASGCVLVHPTILASQNHVAKGRVEEDRLCNGTFELCADGYFNREDVVSVTSEVLDRPVKAAALSFEEWADQTKTPLTGRQVARAMFDYDGKYGSPGTSLTLRAILGREPRTLRQFFEDLVAGVPTVAS